MDRGAWQALVQRVAKSQTERLSVHASLRYSGTLPEMTRKEIELGVNGKIHTIWLTLHYPVSESTECNQLLMENIWEKIPEIPKSNT